MSDAQKREIVWLRAALKEIAEFKSHNPYEDTECQAMAADALADERPEPRQTDVVSFENCEYLGFGWYRTPPATEVFFSNRRVFDDEQLMAMTKPSDEENDWSG